jgi:cell division GTPase FtsZ
MSLVVRDVDGGFMVVVVHLRCTGRFVRLIASAIRILAETSGRLIIVHNGQLVEATDH